MKKFCLMFSVLYDGTLLQKRLFYNVLHERGSRKTNRRAGWYGLGGSPEVVIIPEVCRKQAKRGEKIVIVGR